MKDNHPTLHDKVRAMMADAVVRPVAGLAVGHAKEEADAHGRLEMREAWVVDDTQWLGADLLGQCPAWQPAA